jgi:5-hydroxyisourate hydrolase-like protein (transthyretin family)
VEGEVKNPAQIAVIGAFAAMLCTAAWPQLVQVGADDPDYCYKVEKIRPNLVLKNSTHITGRLTDQTTAPFENSKVQLRKYVSERDQAPVKSVTTDKDGRFDFGLLEAGEYRLLASPSRAFAQPQELHCAEKTCELQITLKVNPTDQVTSQCPIR